MPLKAIYDKKPLTRLQQQFLCNGQVRSRDPFVEKLACACQKFSADPEMWEGLFSLLCLFEKNDPLESEVARLILKTIRDTEDGSFPGEISCQIATARAAYAIYEYNTDRGILKRLISWVRYIEVQWVNIESDTSLKSNAADLMQLLVSLYRITGLKALLRLCSRLRALSFDWTSALHGFNQRQPLSRMINAADLQTAINNDHGDVTLFSTRQYIMNHPEYLSDGIRFTTYSSMYSGNGLDLSAGKDGWKLISRYHGAACGGTTADTLLAGTGTNKAIDTACIAAWCEAFCSQLLLKDSFWAAKEAVIAYQNGIKAAMQNGTPELYQYVNQFDNKGHKPEQFYPLATSQHCLCRMARAVSAVYRSAVCVTERGFDIQMMIPGIYTASVNGNAVTISISDTGIAVRVKQPTDASIDLTGLFNCKGMCLELNQQQYNVNPENERAIISRQWENGDTIEILYAELPEKVRMHHQGIGYQKGNKMLCFDMQGEKAMPAVCGEPLLRDGRVYVPTKKVISRGEGQLLSDIPVLPDTEDETVLRELHEYSEKNCRMTVMPKAKE